MGNPQEAPKVAIFETKPTTVGSLQNFFGPEWTFEGEEDLVVATFGNPEDPFQMTFSLNKGSQFMAFLKGTERKYRAPVISIPSLDEIGLGEINGERVARFIGGRMDFIFYPERLKGSLLVDNYNVAFVDFGKDIGFIGNPSVG